MSGDPQKTPLVQTQQALATTRALDEIARLGRSLPCHVTSVSGQIVTVAFDIAQPGTTLPAVTVPVQTSRYDWLPIQVGDKGVVWAADAYLGGVSGLGGGTATLTQPSNLTALVFAPVANSSWSVPDAGQRVVQGPDGVLLRTVGATSPELNLNTTGIALIAGGHTLEVTTSGISFDGVIFSTHVHDQPNDSAGDTEYPTGAPRNP